ncbi:MAG: alpha/beta hydrolase [Defluviicoccus sp.]|nr:alpha/beta hydrolase [Defluviicoccus sp.]
MPYAQADGARLYYEEAGAGEAIVFVHEFAGDCRSWEPQIRHFSRRYRCVAFNARGYPPSEVPDDQALYSQDIATDDIAAVMRGAGIERAHVVGMSMGGFAALHFGLRHAGMARSIVVGACGYGAKPEESAQYALDSEAIAVEYETRGAAEVAEIYANGAYRLQLKEKDPRGWAEFRDQLAGHSTEGSARTMRGVQKHRPSLWRIDGLAGMSVPALVVAGDEDDWCLEPGIHLKRTIPTAALLILPKTGHAVNLEEPALFNRALADFFATVEAGRWTERPFAQGASALLSGFHDADSGQ